MGVLVISRRRSTRNPLGSLVSLERTMISVLLGVMLIWFSGLAAGDLISQWLHGKLVIPLWRMLLYVSVPFLFGLWVIITGV